MKLMAGRRVREAGFALPTILLISTVMLAILVASVAAAAASRVSLDSQYYNQLAQQAVESGIARANQCLGESGYTPQWSTNVANRDLRPDTDCTGARILSNPYVMDGTANVRTSYSIDAPEGSGVGSSLRVIGTTELTRTSSPDSVWRRYQQVSYLQIEPQQAVACPDGFVAVPGDARFGTNDFCIGKYEAKNVGGRAVSRAEGAPWVNISQIDATAAASQSCTGCRLITQGEWLTVMHNTLGVSSNWSGNSVGSGYIYRGHSDNSPGRALAASADDSDGYFDTGNANGNQRRTLTLNNGEVVWDLAGNVWEWTAETVSGGQPGLPGYAWREWNTNGMNVGSLNPNPFPSFGTPAASSWNSGQGIGRLYSNSTETGLRGILRGSFWNGGINAGVATLNFNDAPTTFNNAVGFRLVFNPLSAIQCRDGHILVPGNSQFGTSNFCVGKYEAKNVGGVATSRASGMPWVDISQTEAMTAASDSCGTCRLISESEWLTIAHNTANIPTNWSGGSVGSGYMYNGHNDNSPSWALEASNDDTNGYFGTGNINGASQRRTLTLNNGEVIWDFAGNAWEWTTGRVSGGKPGNGGIAWRDWNTIQGTGNLSPSPFPVFSTSGASSWTRSNGIGGAYSDAADGSVRGFIRGGRWNAGDNAGVFSLALNNSPEATNASFGFRVTSDPILAISCSDGMIPVPGDSRFNTTSFCVGKYEAKNVGGVAVSQPQGLPWSNISQANAIVAAYNACTDCRLIGEAEWLTIAHNLLNVSSNWSGGSVGSGYIYNGHNDNTPATQLAASSDDNDGYFGTGNSGNSRQRRTLTLSNGQVIWDFAGNAYEWTSGQIGGRKPGMGGLDWRDWQALTDTGALTPSPFPAFGLNAAGNWNGSHGLGRVYSDSSDTSIRGLYRGGARHNGDNAGIFSLGLSWSPTTASSHLSFRIVEIK